MSGLLDTQEKLAAQLAERESTIKNLKRSLVTSLQIINYSEDTKLGLKLLTQLIFDDKILDPIELEEKHSFFYDMLLDFTAEGHDDGFRYEFSLDVLVAMSDLIARIDREFNVLALDSFEYANQHYVLLEDRIVLEAREIVDSSKLAQQIWEQEENKRVRIREEFFAQQNPKGENV